MPQPPNQKLTDSRSLDKDTSEMFELLMEVAADGAVTRAEASKLMAWLVAHRDANIDGAAYLLDVVASAFEDGVLRAGEKAAIFSAIKKMLPPGFRMSMDESSTYGNLDERAGTATDKQIGFLRDLGGTISAGMSKAEASRRIDERLNDNSASPRQRMVLKFFRHEHLSEHGREAVSRWMDRFYAEDSARKRAWEAWKLANARAGKTETLENVPVNWEAWVRCQNQGVPGWILVFALIVPGVAQAATRKYGSALGYFIVGCGVWFFCASNISWQILFLLNSVSFIDGFALNGSLMGGLWKIVVKTVSAVGDYTKDCTGATSIKQGREWKGKIILPLWSERGAVQVLADQETAIAQPTITQHGNLDG